jgi:hypothetical protein
MRIKTGVLAMVLACGFATLAQADTYHHYECTDGAQFDVVFPSGIKAAYLQIDGKSLALPKRFSLISQRFKQGGYSFAMRSGGKAIMKHGGKTSQCQVK